jgi:APA family basic amino acid/polyamine antiporter
MKSLFRTKSLEGIMRDAKKHSLKKTLGSTDLILMGIGAAIGTGIFVLTGIAAAKHAGPAIAISYALAGLICIFVGLAYTELASAIPVSGSAYTYTYFAMGEFIAWLVACGLVLGYAVNAATVAAGWSGYFVGIMHQAGFDIPYYLVKVPSEGGIINLPAVSISLFVGLILFHGTRESIVINRILVALKLIIIFIFLVIAVPHIKMENYADFAPFGTHGILSGAALIFFAYLGFDAVATTAEECKNPKRDIPVGLIGGLVICTIVYIVVALALTGIVNYQTLDNAEPMARALRENGSNIGSALIATGAIAGMVAVLLVMMFGQSRIFLAMSRDGLLPDFFCKVHKKHGTPYLNCLFVTLIVCLVAGFMPIHVIGQMTSVGSLLAFAVVSLGVMVLRVNKPKLERPFTCPAVFIIAPLAIVGCGYLAYTLLLEVGKPTLVWLAFGTAFYFLYSRRKSHLK